MVIGTRSDNENCSIGLIAGPDSAATSSSPRPRRPRTGPRAARLYPGLPRQTSANCANYVAGGAPFGEVTRITFHTPAATPSRKNTIVNAGLVFNAQSRPQPIAPPTRIAATNSLPARRPIDIPEARLSGGLDEFGRGDAAASGRCAFSCRRARRAARGAPAHRRGDRFRWAFDLCRGEALVGASAASSKKFRGESIALQLHGPLDLRA